MRAGTMVCQVEITRDIRDALVGLCILAAADIDDRGQVADACETLLFGLAEGYLDINADCLG